MTFKCRNCGRCCTDFFTQIGLTLGDVQRIADWLGKDPEELFKEHISLMPFGTDTPNIFEIELGMNLPCRFRKDGKCSIYNARPLNCRMFPVWILADVPQEKLLETIDDSHKCMPTELDDEQRRRFREYKEKVGKLILSEAKETDETLNRIFADRVIDISQLPGFTSVIDFEKKLFYAKERNPNAMVEIEKKKFELAKSAIGDDKVCALITGMEKKSFADSEKICGYDYILKS